MRSFLSILILPLSVFWVAILLALVFYFQNKIRASKIFMTGSLIWLLSVSTGFIPNLLISSLEKQYQPIESILLLDTLSFHIVVLGAGHTSDNSLTANNQLTTNALGRLVEGIRIHQLIPGSKLILSGGPGTEKIAHAKVMKEVAIMFGVKDNDIYTLNTTINTADEAMKYKKAFGVKHQVILVTSAIHMPRSMQLFRRQEINPIAAPANPIIKKGDKINYLAWLPSANNIKKMELIIHEYTGMLWVQLTK